MVMTPDRRGISCDLCSAEHRDKFVYYSARIDKVVVDSAIKKTGAADVDRRLLDVDMCPSCYEKMVEQMKKTISERGSKAQKDEKNKASEWTTGA